MEREKANRDEHHSIPRNPIDDHRSNIDSSRPFSSVKEAVAIFGQRIHLPQHTQTPKPKPKSPSTSPSLSQGASTSSSPWIQPSLPCSPSDPNKDFIDALKKLEAELKETKTEVKLLKERESETEVALATLNAELNKNMSKISEAKADAAGKSAASTVKTANLEMREEEKRKELMKKMEREYPTVGQILNGNKGNREIYYYRKDIKKKKPIVPLVGDLFFRKRGLSGNISMPMSSTLHFIKPNV